MLWYDILTVKNCISVILRTKAYKNIKRSISRNLISKYTLLSSDSDTFPGAQAD